MFQSTPIQKYLGSPTLLIWPGYHRCAAVPLGAAPSVGESPLGVISAAHNGCEGFTVRSVRQAHQVYPKIWCFEIFEKVIHRA